MSHLNHIFNTYKRKKRVTYLIAFLLSFALVILSYNKLFSYSIISISFIVTCARLRLKYIKANFDDLIIVGLERGYFTQYQVNQKTHRR